MDWIKNKWEWMHVYAPKMKPTILKPKEMLKISTHKHPEGVLISGEAAFDSPMCGVRIRAEPGLDTARTFVLNYLIASGLTEPNNLIFTAIPPKTPPGVFVMHTLREWAFKNLFELYVFNDDTVPHTYLMGDYVLEALVKERPTPKREIEE